MSTTADNDRKPVTERCDECMCPLCHDGSRCPECHGRGIAEFVRERMSATDEMVVRFDA